MDSDTFKKWLQFRYVEIQKKSSGPWLLLLDNCSGHKDLPILNGVSYQFLPANTTAHFQPMDQGLICATKKNYKALFLRRAVEVIQGFMAGGNAPQNVNVGRAGIKEGRLPHIADAMDLMDTVWESISARMVIHCWIKSECLPAEHVMALKELASLTGDTRYDEELREVNDEVAGIIRSCAAMDLRSVPDSPISQVARTVAEEGSDVVLKAISEQIPEECRLQEVLSDTKLCVLYKQSVQED